MESGKKDRLRWRTVSTRYLAVKCEKQLRRFKQENSESGNRFEKLKMIDQHTLNKFVKAKSKKLIVHDYDLKGWALLKQADVNVKFL